MSMIPTNCQQGILPDCSLLHLRNCSIQDTTTRDMENLPQQNSCLCIVTDLKVFNKQLWQPPYAPDVLVQSSE